MKSDLWEDNVSAYCWYLEFVRKREINEQDERTSPQQPKARPGECRGWETGQEPPENGWPQEKATQGAEREDTGYVGIRVSDN